MQVCKPFKEKKRKTKYTIRYSNIYDAKTVQKNASAIFLPTGKNLQQNLYSKNNDDLNI